MKEYTLKNKDDISLAIGEFETEQQAWNVLCIRTASRFLTNEMAFLYDKHGNCLYAQNHTKPYEHSKKEVEYEFVINPRIYRSSQSFHKDLPIEEVWEKMRKDAIKVEGKVSYHAKLMVNNIEVLEGSILSSFIKKLPIETKKDLLYEISKIKI